MNGVLFVTTRQRGVIVLKASVRVRLIVLDSQRIRHVMPPKWVQYCFALLFVRTVSTWFRVPGQCFQ